MGSRVDIYFPSKTGFIHTIIDRSQIRIGGAGSVNGGGGTGPTDLSINGSPFETITGSAYDLAIKDSAGAAIGTPNAGANEVVVGDSSLALRDSASVLLDTVTQKAQATGSKVLDDLQVVVKDDIDNEILSTSFKAYSTSALDLTALSANGIVIGQNSNVEVSSTPPPTPVDGDIWFQPT